MLRSFFLLISFFVLVANHAAAQCQPPTNQPTALVFKKVSKTKIEGEFTAADNTGGVAPADKYIVVRVTSTAPPVAPTPANGTAYAPPAQIGNGVVVHYGVNANFTDNGVTENETYYYFVYAAKDAPTPSGPCYNTTNPLSKSIKAEGEDEVTEKKDSSTSSILSPLLNFNFVGNKNGWSNLTPVVFYGWSKTGNTTKKVKDKDGAEKKKRLFGNTFQVGPYIGSTISIKDSTSYLPAIMLPGNAGLEMNYFLTLGDEKKLAFIFSPINFGLKVVSGFKDTSLAVVQHSIRHSFGISYANNFSMSVQYTKGWHNSTSNSEENYGKIFPGASTTARYWNVSINTRLSNDLFGANNTGKAPLVLSLNWRSMVAPSDFKGLPNSRFITIGLISTIDLKTGANPGLLPRSPL